MKIYLAGKITKNGWRDTITTELAPYYSDDAFPTQWPTAERVIDGRHDYVGPFFIRDDHGCAHGASAHGVDASSESACIDCAQPASTPQGDERRAAVIGLCFDAIKRADIVFAWIEDQTAFGTLVEIGYAIALMKPVYIGVPAGVALDDSWFVIHASTSSASAGSAREAFDGALLFHLANVDGPAKRRSHFDAWKSRCESPIEAEMFEAMFWSGNIGIDESTGEAGNTTHDLYQQHETCGYRLDFALVPRSASGRRIAIECDGHDFHDRTPEQAARDKSRDRKLTEAGWTVLRFTGREIHRKADDCAAQVWRVARGS